MTTLTYTIDIKAAKQHVWDIMLADKTYREWTSAFHEGSYYEGSWDKGSEIRFLAEDEGEVSGMFSTVVENIPGEFVSVKHLGEVVDGHDERDSEGARQWSGGHENYRFQDHRGGTRLTIELDASETLPDEVIEMFDEMWPPALEKLKSIAERGA